MTRARTEQEWRDLARAQPLATAKNPGAPYDTLIDCVRNARRDPNLLQDVLAALAANPGLKLMLAANTLPTLWWYHLPPELLARPDCPTAILHAAGEHLRDYPGELGTAIGNYLLKNPTTTEAILERLRDAVRQHTIRHLRIRDINQHQNSRSAQRDPQQDLQQAYARTSLGHQAISLATRHAYLRPDIETLMLKRNPRALIVARHLRADAIEGLAQIMPLTDLHKVIQHPDMTDRAFDLIAQRRDAHDMLLHQLVLDDRLPSSTRAVIVDRLLAMGQGVSGNPHDALHDLARDRQTPPHALERLAREGSASLRGFVASNPSTPLDTLHLLTEDPEERVRNAAESALTHRGDHNRATYQALAYLRRSPHDTDYALLLAALDPLPTAIAEVLARHAHPLVRLAIADHPHTPHEQLEALRRDTDRRVATRAQQHLQPD